MEGKYAYRWDWIINWINQHGYKLGAEIGVYRGRNLFNILDGCPDLHMLAVDQWIRLDGGVKQNSLGQRQAESARMGYPIW